jgi:hypothetical protein
MLPRSTLLMAALFLASALSAQQQAKTPLTNDDIIQMVSNGFPENVVIGSISANDANFDVSAKGLLALKKANVSEKIMEAMLSAQTKQRDTVHSATSQAPAATYATAPRMGAMGVPIMNSPGAQAPVQLPTIALMINGQKLPLQPSSTEIAQSKGKGGSAAGGILKGFGKGMLMAGGAAGAPVPHLGGGGTPRMPGVTYTWALPGRTAAFVLPTRSVDFEIEFEEIAGVDPDVYEPVIVKLIQTRDNWRLVETSKDKFDKHGNDTRSSKTEDKTPLKITPLGRGHLRVASASELTPGEYALVLHPKKDQKEFAGVPAANVEALFYSVWDFSVPAGESAPASTVPKH